MAQLVARLVRNEKVRSSNLLSSTTRMKKGHPFRIFGRVAFSRVAPSQRRPRVVLPPVLP